ncbi:MAG: TonB-dependent receptor [Candidatus Eremiobacteraeota bacterium]|nr:TonB-dependent receptor [Candidatus Eremiobacteraeota bacterium]
MIDIITRSPGASGGSASAYAEGGYEGTFEDGVSITRGDARTLWVHASGRSLHARNSYDYPAFADAAAGTRTNDDVNLAEASLDVGKALGTTRAELRLNQDESNVGSPGDVTCCISGLARQQRDVRRADITIDALTRLGMLSLQGYVDSRRLHFFDPTPPLRYDTFTSALSRGFSLRDTSAVGRDHTFTLGYDVRDDGALFAASYYTAPASVDDASSAFYLEDEVRRPGSPLSVSAGLRRELPQGTQAPVTPSLGIVERLAHGFALRANYGRAFRVPSLDERYFPSYGNPKLQPEYSATFDAGAALDLKGGDASLTYFGSDSENLIVNVPVDAVGDEKPFNIDRARIRGIDGQVTSRVGTLTSARLSLTSLFAARDLESGRPLPYRPGMSVAVTAWHTSRSTEYGLSGRYVGRRDAPGTSRSIALPAYALGDAWVTRRFGSGTKLTLRLENIGGSHAEEDVLGYPVLGPTASLRVSIAR